MASDAGLRNGTALIIGAAGGIGLAAAGDLAYGFGLLRCGRQGDTFPVRLTVCLRRIDGAWTIVHEHHSVPAAES